MLQIHYNYWLLQCTVHIFIYVYKIVLIEMAIGACLIKSLNIIFIHIYIISIAVICIPITNIVGRRIYKWHFLNVIQNCSNEINFHLGYIITYYYYNLSMYTSYGEMETRGSHAYTWWMKYIFYLPWVHILWKFVRLLENQSRGTCEHVLR